MKHRSIAAMYINVPLHARDGGRLGPAFLEQVPEQHMMGVKQEKSLLLLGCLACLSNELEAP